MSDDFADLDKTDLEILHILQDGPYWKKRIHDEIEYGDVSVQTIGRRVDQLVDKGYLNSSIMSPDEINRDLIIAFKLTDDGEEALEAVKLCENAPECGELLGDDVHLHDPVSAREFFASAAPEPTDADRDCTTGGG